jgi:hypothetical protein
MNKEVFENIYNNETGLLSLKGEYGLSELERMVVLLADKQYAQQKRQDGYIDVKEGEWEKEDWVNKPERRTIEVEFYNFPERKIEKIELDPSDIGEDQIEDVIHIRLTDWLVESGGGWGIVKKKPECYWCAKGDKPEMLDEDGTKCAITGKPGKMSHALDDAFWECQSAVTV